MSARANFADNLRRLCLTKGSISAASREMGVHRAQLEKYLSGEREPSAAVRKHIAEHFGVDEATLFLPPEQFTIELPKPSKIQISAEVRKAVAPLLDEPIASIPKGIYHIYFTVPGTPDQLYMSTIVVTRVGNATLFRRLTGWGIKRDTYWARFTGDHKGIVVERLNVLSFVAANQRGQHEPTLMRLHWLPVASPLLGGHAMVLTHSGASFSAVVMQPVPSNTKLRDAIRSAQPRPSNDPTLPVLVREFIPAMRRELIEWIRRDVAG
ncbi:helix-turn-helix domain-containing protein [Shinella sp. G-2]|uniref:helix-turn-helix domain-containing protein n=1 Tax=Shinella sp. G-2 TaxID=3133141 RepID=UPI003D07EDDA